jgi:hypothetical protein
VLFPGAGVITTAVEFYPADALDVCLSGEYPCNYNLRTIVAHGFRRDSGNDSLRKVDALRASRRRWRFGWRLDDRLPDRRRCREPMDHAVQPVQGKGRCRVCLGVRTRCPVECPVSSSRSHIGHSRILHARARKLPWRQFWRYAPDRHQVTLVSL